jgi:hypothetical protein
MASLDGPASPRVVYGWWLGVVAGAGIRGRRVFLSGGIRFTVGPFLKPVVAFGFLGMTSIAGGLTLGLLSDRYGRKSVPVAGGR